MTFLAGLKSLALNKYFSSSFMGFSLFNVDFFDWLRSPGGLSRLEEWGELEL